MRREEGAGSWDGEVVEEALGVSREARVRRARAQVGAQVSAVELDQRPRELRSRSLSEPPPHQKINGSDLFSIFGAVAATLVRHCGVQRTRSARSREASACPPTNVSLCVSDLGEKKKNDLERVGAYARERGPSLEISSPVHSVKIEDRLPQIESVSSGRSESAAKSAS